MAKLLDGERPGWRDKHLLLRDNMRAHRSEFSLRVLRCLQFPVFLTAPAGYSCLADERMIAICKNMKSEDLGLRDIK